MKDYKKYKKAKKDNNLAKTGQVTGATIGTIGAAALVGSHKVKKAIEKTTTPELQQNLVKVSKDSGKVIQRLNNPELVKNLKKVGIVALPAGAALVAGSTVLKKKSDKRLKEFGDETKKKK